MSILSTLKKMLIVDKNNLPKLEWLSAGEHFIPIYFMDILNRVLEDERLSETEREHFRTLALMLEEHYHLDYQKDFLQLKNAFAPFDPDTEVRYFPEYSEAHKEECRAQLIHGVENFLSVCNFREMTEEQCAELLEARYPGILSIKVDMRKLEFFRIFYRGIHHEEKTGKALWLLKENYPSLKFKRIFVLARYKKEHENRVLVKVFRDVDVENLKVVVPEVRLCLPIRDQIKVGASFSGALGTTILKIILAASFKLALLIPMLATFALGFFRSISGFFNSRMKCLKTYSESLYHQSLASNMGAVNLLVEQAETQEVKEAFLAYFMLYVCRKENLTMEELDARVEAWLEKNFGFNVDFEVDDALRKLVDKNLALKFPHEDESAAHYKVYDLPTTLRRLDELWDNYHQENNLGDSDHDLLAV
ncbi:MAG: DUF3754 domain-containing protein [Thermoguttaceae bacterium]|nr:DUF3754 domain-containing protein [Thermoguttaceae bacterium]